MHIKIARYRCVTQGMTNFICYVNLPNILKVGNGTPNLLTY